MATAWFGPCPHCNVALSYLEGVTGSKMDPQCPSCHETITVQRATFLMADHSLASLSRKAPPPPKPS